MWRGCFERIYVFSPTAFIDDQWNEVRSYMSKELGQDERNDPGFFDEWDPGKIKDIIETQKKVVAMQKKQYENKKGQTKGGRIYQVMIIIDDFASDTQVMNDPVLKILYTKGRHYFVNVMCSIQKYRLANTVLRSQATLLVYFCGIGCRSMVDLEAFLEENSGLVPGGKKTLLAMFEAVKRSGPHSFMAVDMLQKDPDKMFMLNLQQYLVVT